MTKLYTITKVPDTCEDEVPYDEEGLTSWVHEVFLEGYKVPGVDEISIESALDILEGAGYTVEVNTVLNLKVTVSNFYDDDDAAVYQWLCNTLYNEGHGQVTDISELPSPSADSSDEKVETLLGYVRSQAGTGDTEAQATLKMLGLSEDEDADREAALVTKLAELRSNLGACGGRNVELAEEIDELACSLGECVYGDECQWDGHEENN